MPVEQAVVCERLQVVRGGRKALDDLSATVRAGAVTGLLGPSGSGKSTLMRAIVGVQVIASGSVTVLRPAGGQPGSASPDRLHDPGPVGLRRPDRRENLRYFASVLDAPLERVDEVIDAVGLEAEHDQVVDRLSGGQRARVSLAAALVGEPELLVLDEPTVGLDPVLRRDLWAMFSELAADGDDAARLEPRDGRGASTATSCCCMREGRLLATGTPRRAPPPHGRRRPRRRLSPPRRRRRSR